MKKRVKNLDRLQRIQKDLYDLSLWRLNALDGQLQALQTARQELIDVKGSDPMYQGPSGVLATTRLKSVERDVMSVKESHRALTQQLLNQGGRLRTAERLLKKADADYRSQVDRSQLSDIIERALRDKTTS